MRKKFDMIINVLIIVLIIALITVMMSYYTGALDVPTNNESFDVNTEVNNSGDNSIINVDNKEKQNDEQIIVIDNKDSGETLKNEQEIINENPNEVKIEEIESGDVESEDAKNNDIVKDVQETPSTSPVIITSENDISSKEKKEILTELDKTLMELLEVVDKVQTVDESRLITDDSEVQE